MITEISSAGARAPRALSVLRIVTAFLFMLHGSAKLLQLPATGHFAHLQLFSLLGLAGALELVGGFLVLIGLVTRPIAFILSGEMAVAYFMAHAPRSAFPVVNQGDAAVLFCFIFLYLAFAGGGPWSIDAWRRRARSAAAESKTGTHQVFAGPERS